MSYVQQSCDRHIHIQVFSTIEELNIIYMNTSAHPPIPAARLLLDVLCLSVFSSTWEILKSGVGIYGRVPLKGGGGDTPQLFRVFSEGMEQGMEQGVEWGVERIMERYGVSPTP